ncbi:MULTISPECIES: hypothetical protein [Streptomyces violaceusniger group]|uniref:hypothetical protein n=1 Tax=Streptomyces violaceusniger group TaxID=2839105 RepID=UPI00131A6675|nr:MULTISPECIES: hypothetical protein [Streptomyces violaceusniger group]
MNTLAFSARFSGRTRPSRAGWRRSATTSSPRIAEAEREGWLGEVEGLQVSLAAAEDKLTQLDAEAARRSIAVDLGMPAFGQIALGTRETKEPTPYVGP